jgi:uncharacterized protein (TIGR03067 family)
MRAQAWFVMVAALLVAADDPKDEASKELDRLTGTWKLVSMEENGKAAPSDVIKDGQTVMNREKWTLTLNGEKMTGTQKVDPTKKPKQIEGTVDSGKLKGQTGLGIYELSDDTYKLCVAGPGKERPKEFTTKPDDGCTLFVYKRVKP